MPATAKRSKQSPKTSKEARPFADLADRVVDVLVHEIINHVDNRDPGDVSELAASFREHGVLEPITVRKLPADSMFVTEDEFEPGQLQLVFGGRRLMAAKEAKLQTIPAIVRDDLSDAHTLILMGEENAKRDDLDPIQKAQHIELLCKPTEKGGAGLTREQAAKVMGLKTGQAASNLARLLQLPDVWLERIRSGEVPQSFARSLLAYTEAPQILALIDDEWREAHEPGERDRWRMEAWSTRESFEDSVADIAHQHTRRLDPDAQHWTSLEYRHHPPYVDFESEEDRKALGVVELPIGDDGELVPAATNVEEFDKRQDAIIQQRLDGKGQKAKATGKAKERKKTDAELKHEQRMKLEQHKRRLEAWRHAWIRSLIAERIEAGQEQVTKLLLWMATNNAPSAIAEAIRETTGRRPTTADYTAIDKTTDAAELAAAAARHLIAPEQQLKWSDAGGEKLPVDLVDRLAASYQIDLDVEWLEAHDAHTREQREHVRRFYELHTSEQLDKLARELKAGELFGTKASKVDALVQSRLPLAKRVKRLPTSKKIRRKK